MKLANLTPAQWARLGGVAHGVVGMVTVVLIATGILTPAIGVAILTGLGGFWSGVGVAYKVSGPPVAATGPKGATTAPDATPTSAFMESVRHAGQ